MAFLPSMLTEHQSGLVQTWQGDSLVTGRHPPLTTVHHPALCGVGGYPPHTAAYLDSNRVARGI
jgi:hypothetical protein